MIKLKLTNQQVTLLSLILRKARNEAIFKEDVEACEEILKQISLSVGEKASKNIIFLKTDIIKLQEYIKQKDTNEESVTIEELKKLSIKNLDKHLRKLLEQGVIYEPQINKFRWLG